MSYDLQILIEKIWTYAVEIILALFVCSILWIYFGSQIVFQWQIERKSDLLGFTSIAGVTAAAIFAAFFAILATDFGAQLRKRGAAAEYTSAFAFPMLLFGLTTATLLFLAKGSYSSLSRCVTFLLCYSCINCYTMVKNVIGIVRLWQEFEQMQKK